MKKISLAEANTAGLTKYFTGNPCKRGHIVERFTKNKTCVECDREWRQRNKQQIKNRNAEYYQRNVEKYHQYYEQNAERYKENEQRFRTANPGRINAYSAKRRAALLQATVAWSELEEIAKLYEQAQKDGYQVDHVIPLQGKTVCGLHVLDNLQLLPEEVNNQKRNKIIEGEAYGVRPNLES